MRSALTGAAEREESHLNAPIGWLLVFQLILIGINSFFAAAEIAVVSLNEAKIRHEAEKGDKKAKKILKMVEAPSAFLSTIQIAITLAGFLGSAFAADNFATRLVRIMTDRWHITFVSPGTLNTVSVILITLVLSFFTLVIGELVPKRIAMKNPDKVARSVCGVITAAAAVFKPAVWLLTAAVHGVLRLFGIDPTEEGENISEDEIRMMVDIGEENGAIEGGERDMIDNIFEFNNLTAGECMTHRTNMVALQVDASSQEVLRVIRQSGRSRYPVYGEDLDDIIGTVTARDYLLSRVSSPRVDLRDLMRKPFFVPESVAADELFRDMQQRKNHLAVVVDEYGGTAGVITMEDLLEEIVGNIYDEYDRQLPDEIRRVGKNKYRVAGNTDLETLREVLKVDIPDAPYETLGGLVFSRLSFIPRDGTHPEVDACGMHIRVEVLRRHRVLWATVTLPDSPVSQGLKPEPDTKKTEEAEEKQ